MTKLQLVTENLLETITKLAEKAEEIYILTSFVMQSGVKGFFPLYSWLLCAGQKLKFVRVTICALPSLRLFNC